MTIADDILVLLQQHPEGLDDDEIASLLHLSQRQTANQAARKLAAASKIRRMQSGGKLRNFTFDATRNVLPASSVLNDPYLEHNRREYELTKHVSVRQLDPMALIQLRETGGCEINLPEALFDVDCPAYLRRIKSVGVSIPCVTGPYTSVNCRLTLLNSKVRRSSLGVEPYECQGPDDNRFTVDYGMHHAMVTSGSVNDSGLFETNLRDERYLWFEGSGVISKWRLELPDEFRQFDYDTISDVVLHLRYTAREGGEPFRSAAGSALAREFKAATSLPLARLISLRHEYPSEWARLAASTGAGRIVTITITKDGFPFLFQDKKHDITITKVDVVGAGKDKMPPTMPAITLPGTGPALADAESIGRLSHVAVDSLNIEVGGANSSWTFAGGAELVKLQDLLMVLTYKVQ